MSHEFNPARKARNAAQKPKLAVFCIHCSRSLGVMRSAVERARAEARHICPEKLLARQPAAPPPFN